MKRKLLIVLVATMGSVFQINAQDKSMMVTVGPEVIGAACTNCGLLVGAGATFDYGVLEKITVGAMFNYYLNKDVDGFIGWNESVIHVGGGASFYIKERFKGFYIGPDLGFISYKLDYAPLKHR